ncbi:MAG: type IX secretion system outer membrane channel protein PorV [Flavobacteriales bacterium]|nr:type IX secretion system outer membrane channel protein PorV [Flavobacteriales bacterium]
MSLSIRHAAAFCAIPAFTALHAQVSQGCISELSGQECGPRLNTITTAVPFLMIGPDSRSGGMGDAGVALPADANAMHWNPSKLAFAENEGEFRVSVSPWLRNLVPDMSLAYLAGYRKLKNKRSAIGGSLRYFNLGSITFTDMGGNTIRDFKPAEFAVDLAFAQQFSDRFSGGIALRYINSNLTGGLNVNGANTKAGQAVAADVSFFYRNTDILISSTPATLAFGLNISNIGNKMSYSETSRTDFLPINLRLGPALTVDIDEYNSLTFNADINKLLVPTPPVYKTVVDDEGKTTYVQENGEYVVFSGQDPNRGVAAGIFGSFNDAPGNVYVDANGEQHVEEGSQFKEELREFYYGGGLEYWYAKQFAFRTGYFWEAATKGDRKYFTMGLGVKYSIFSLDFSYLIANTTRSPLANTLRFTLGFNFDGKAKKKADTGE